VGELMNNKLHGKGILITAERKVVEGQFKNGVKI
jgi:hypothetical protein